MIRPRTLPFRLVRIKEEGRKITIKEYSLIVNMDVRVGEGNGAEFESPTSNTIRLKILPGDIIKTITFVLSHNILKQEGDDTS